MRIYAITTLLLVSTTGFSDTIQKWTDESGQVHYGDNPPHAVPHQIERLEIKNDFDPDAYEQAEQRNAELYREISLIEKQEKRRAKIAEKDLQKYFDQLDKESRDLERKKLSKRKARESERNRASIKLKRTSTAKQPTNNAKYKQYPQ